MASGDPVHDRLANQQLTGPGLRGPGDVVRRMGAMQAQDYGQALWAVGCRLKDATTAAVVDAIESAEILRTWPMRGTIHFVPAEDARWMVDLTASRIFATEARRLAQLELDESLLRRCHQLLRRVLAGGKRLTRPRLMELLEESGVSTAGQRGYHVLTHAAMRGVICLGPMEGKQQTFVLLEEWAPDPRTPPQGSALGELARRYFTGHGPATAQDFAWWTGLTVTQAREGIAAASADLARQESDGAVRWTGKARVRRAAAGPLLLPGFDEYLLGYKDRGAVLPAEHANSVVPGGNGVFFPTMVLDGQVVGTWKRTITAKDVSLVLTPFDEIGDALEGFCAQAERYARFVGLPLRAATVAPARLGA